MFLVFVFLGEGDIGGHYSLWSKEVDTSDAITTARLRPRGYSR